MYPHTSIEDIDWLQIEQIRRSHDRPSLVRETNAFVIYLLSITNLFINTLLDFIAQCSQYLRRVQHVEIIIWILVDLF